MTALMFTTAMLMFFMGLVSEQITALMYKTEGSRPIIPDVNTNNMGLNSEEYNPTKNTK